MTIDIDAMAEDMPSVTPEAAALAWASYCGTANNLGRMVLAKKRGAQRVPTAEADAAVAAFLARGGQVTQCAPAYVLPVAGK